MTGLKFSYQDGHPLQIARDSIAEMDFELVLWEQAEPDDDAPKGHVVYYTLTDVAIDKKSGIVSLNSLQEFGTAKEAALKEFEDADIDLTQEAAMAAEHAAGWPRYYRSDEEDYAVES